MAVLRLLLDRGARVDVKDSSGRTPVEAAQFRVSSFDSYEGTAGAFEAAITARELCTEEEHAAKAVAAAPAVMVSRVFVCAVFFHFVC